MCQKEKHGGNKRNSSSKPRILEEVGVSKQIAAFLLTLAFPSGPSAFPEASPELRGQDAVHCHSCGLQELSKQPLGWRRALQTPQQCSGLAPQEPVKSAKALDFTSPEPCLTFLLVIISLHKGTQSASD